MLYLPPGVGHHGIAEDDCITLSIGFRAPSVDDVLTGFSDFLCSQPGAGQPLADPDLRCQDNPGAISGDALARVHEVIASRLNDHRQLALWFGQFSTSPKNQDLLEPAEPPMQSDDVRDAIAQGLALRWNEGSRFAYHEFMNDTALFVDGEQFILRGDARQLAQLLCRGNRISAPELIGVMDDPALCGLLCNLVNQGHLYLE
jgi:50S ribosomal protein L16 3-hydroxylase